MGFKITYKNVDTALDAVKMLELRNKVSVSVLSGNFKNAKSAQKEFAKMAVNDFETFKTLPVIKISNISWGQALVAWFRSLEYKVYKIFSTQSPEEKLFKKQYSKYLKMLDKQA